MNKFILKLALCLAIIFLPFTLKRPFLKDRLLAFLFQGFIASFISNFVVGQRVIHPVRFFPQYFRMNILYEYLVLPLIGVWFNQTTFRSKWPGMIGQAFLYGGIHTWLESIIEKKTNLVTWKRWTWLHNLISLSSLFVAVRGIMALVRKYTH